MICFQRVENAVKTLWEKEKMLGKLRENIVGKGENASNQHFLLFPQCFHTVFYSSKTIVGKRENTGYHFFPFPTMFQGRKKSCLCDKTLKLLCRL